jgi:hypothetical protein
MKLYFSFQQQIDAEKLGVSAEELKNSFETGDCPQCSLKLTYRDYDTPLCADCGFPEHDFSDN